MATPTMKLARLADDILRSLDQLEDSGDPAINQVRGHVLSLAQLLGANPTIVEDMASGLLHERSITPTEAPGPKKVRGFKLSTQPPHPHQQPDFPIEAKRPGLYTERRAARQQSGVTLAQVKQKTGMSMPTIRMYEVRPASVRPDKRLQLDQIYSSFAHSPTK